MSSIQDIASLDDILHSPSSSETDTAEDGEVRFISNGNQSSKEALDLQKRKDQLNQRRDELLEQRAQLKKEVDKLRMEASYLNVKNHKQKLESAQVKNADEIEIDTPIDNETQQILDQMNVLPLQNWQKRLEYARKSCPFIEILDLKQIEYENEKVMQYVAKASDPKVGFLFQIEIHIHINEQGQVMAINTPNEADLVTLSLYSTTYFSILARNYVPNKKLNLLMYSLNSLAHLISMRIHQFQLISDQFEIEENSILTTSNTITVLTTNATIKLIWLIQLEDTISGELQSEIKAFFNGDDVSEIYQNLLKEGSIVDSLKIIIENLSK